MPSEPLYILERSPIPCHSNKDINVSKSHSIEIQISQNPSTTFSSKEQTLQVKRWELEFGGCSQTELYWTYTKNKLYKGLDERVFFPSEQRSCQLVN